MELIHKIFKDTIINSLQTVTQTIIREKLNM